MKKKVLFAAVFMLLAVGAYAQGNGIAGNALTRGFIIPKEMQDKEAVSRFLECCEQFERIINDSGFITLTRLTGDEITGIACGQPFLMHKKCSF